jgi:TRAP-type C4-dicarboxylate transport system substrate-binding protein
MLMNKKRLESFSPEIQKAIREAGKKAENYQLDYIQKALADNLEKIKAKGVKVNVITNRGPFQNAVKDIVAKYESEIGKDLIQAVRDAK